MFWIAKLCMKLYQVKYLFAHLLFTSTVRGVLTSILDFAFNACRFLSHLIPKIVRVSKNFVCNVLGWRLFLKYPIKGAK